MPIFSTGEDAERSHSAITALDHALVELAGTSPLLGRSFTLEDAELAIDFVESRDREVALLAEEWLLSRAVFYLHATQTDSGWVLHDRNTGLMHDLEFPLGWHPGARPAPVTRDRFSRALQLCILRSALPSRPPWPKATRSPQARLQNVSGLSASLGVCLMILGGVGIILQLFSSAISTDSTCPFFIYIAGMLAFSLPRLRSILDNKEFEL